MKLNCIIYKCLSNYHLFKTSLLWLGVLVKPGTDWLRQILLLHSYETENCPLTATLMPRLPPLFFSSMVKCSAVLKLMMDGDLEQASWEQVEKQREASNPTMIASWDTKPASSHLGVVYPHHRDVESLAHFGGGHAGQVDGLLQLLHGRTELRAAQRGLRAKTSFQGQTQSALTEGRLAVPQRRCRDTKSRQWRSSTAAPALVTEWVSEWTLHLGWDTMSSTSSGLLCKIAAASEKVTPSKLVLLREMRRPPGSEVHTLLQLLPAVSVCLPAFATNLV